MFFVLQGFEGFEGHPFLARGIRRRDDARALD